MNYVITMTDGTQWSIPVYVIAWHKASAQQTVDNRPKNMISSILEEFAESPELIEDWAKNHMTWEDVKDEAKRLDSEESNYNEDWSTAKAEITYDY